MISSEQIQSCVVLVVGEQELGGLCWGDKKEVLSSLAEMIPNNAPVDSVSSAVPGPFAGHGYPNATSHTLPHSAADTNDACVVLVGCVEIKQTI